MQVSYSRGLELGSEMIGENTGFCQRELCKGTLYCESVGQISS